MTSALGWLFYWTGAVSWACVGIIAATLLSWRVLGWVKPVRRKAKADPLIAHYSGCNTPHPLGDHCLYVEAEDEPGAWAAMDRAS